MARRPVSLALLPLVATAVLMLLAVTAACRGGGGGNEIVPTGDGENSLTGRWSFRHSNGEDVHLVSCAPGLEHLAGLTYAEALSSHPQFFSFEDLTAIHDETRLHFFVYTDLGNGLGTASSRGGGTVSGDTLSAHIEIIDFTANTRTSHTFSGSIRWPATVDLAEATFFVNVLGNCSFAPPLLMEGEIAAP